MLNKPETKILVVIDGTYASRRTEDENELVMNTAANILTEAGFDTDTDIMCCLTESGTDCDPETIMNDIDEFSKELCMDDYDCVVAEGAAGWFWLQCRYPLPVVCVNPVMKPVNTFDDIIGSYEANAFRTITRERELNISESACIISAENEDETPCEFFQESDMTYSDEFSYTQEFWKEVACKVSELLDEI